MKRADDLPKPLLVYLPDPDEAGFHPGEGDAAVHCTAVQIEEAELLGNQFGKCTFSGRGKAVHGYNDVWNAAHIT